MSQPETEVAPSARRRPARWILLVAAAAVAVLAAAAGAYIFVFDDRGQFDAEPPECATIAPSLHLLGVAYTTEQRESGGGCGLLLPRDHPAYVDAPKIIVAFGVADTPDEADKTLRPLEADSRAVSGVGDRAYRSDGGLYLRVSNLVVGVVVFPNPVSTEEQVMAFATDLANRLRNT